MKKSSFILLTLLANFILVRGESLLTLHVEQVFTETNIDKPIQLCFPSNHPSKILLVLQEGRILILSKDGENKSENVFLDWTDRGLIEKNFEEGLLGLALHPSFQENRLFYVYHTIQNPKRTVVTELRTLNNANQLIMDQSYEREIISIRQPYWNHNSGIPCFGPDGYLYLSTGDGGKANDPNRFSQNTFSLLGKILRIDVDSKDSSSEYKIPPGNPFIDVPGFREEIWAVGLRNPWRLSWDFVNGNLFCADVGQHKLEEVNLIHRGGNYGWNDQEGSQPFEFKNSTKDDTGSIKPIFEYSHDLGTSITGGMVYQGQKHPSFKGKYIFGDWGTGRCWVLSMDGDSVTTQQFLLKENKISINPSPGQSLDRSITPFKPVNFHEGLDGEIYALDWKGRIYRSL